MTLFWLLWFGFIMLLAGAWLAAYAWNASALGLIQKGKARKYWNASTTAFLAGAAVLAYAFASIIGARIDRGFPKSFTEFWLVAGIMAAGFAACCLASRRGKAGRNLFYVGLALLGAGFLGLAWLTYPENLLIGVLE